MSLLAAFAPKAKNSAVGFVSPATDVDELPDVLSALGITTEDAYLLMTTASESLFSAEDFSSTRMHAESIGAKVVEFLTTALQKERASKKMGFAEVVLKIRELNQAHSRFKTILYSEAAPLTAAHIAFVAPYSKTDGAKDVLEALRPRLQQDPDFRFTGPFSSMIPI